MLEPIDFSLKGIVLVTGPTKSGKSELAEFFLSTHKHVTYIATSAIRKNDVEWQKRLEVHKRRRPKDWKLLESPFDICNYIRTVSEKDSILIDSIGGLVEQHLSISTIKWEAFKDEFVQCLIDSNSLIVIVSEEIGWGIIPSTSAGHLFRERLSNFSSSLSKISIRNWLAIQRYAIDIDHIGFKIP